MAAAQIDMLGKAREGNVAGRVAPRPRIELGAQL